MNPTRRDTSRCLGLAAVVATPLLLVACTADTGAPTATGPSGVASLVSYSSCDELLTYFTDNALERVTAWGLGDMALYGDEAFALAESGDGMAMPRGGTAASADSALVDPQNSVTFSSGDQGTSATNNQVEGVDEADIVKTDGDILVAIVAGEVQVIDAATAQAVATVDLTGVSTPSELLLQGSTLVVLGAAADAPPGEDPMVLQDGVWGGGYGWGRPARTVLTQVDLSDPAAPEVLQSTRVEGAYRSARLIDSTVRLVMVSDPPGLEWVQPEGSSLEAETEALDANRALIEESTITDWLPNLSVDGGAVEPLLGCGDVGVSTEFSGFTSVSVVTLDVDGGTVPTSSAAVLGSGETVYASSERVIVASTGWDLWGGGSGGGTTDLHAFDISDPTATSYVGSGRVEGRVLDQFAIDEADGVVRVATTQDAGVEPSSSSLVVLDEREGVGLVVTGRVDGLGETEQIYSVRYLSPDLAAVVTFRQVDPLYLIDTSDPAAPALAGELSIPGYSAYLHPLDDDYLLGVGQDATTNGGTTGLQASLFDISDPSTPQRVSTVTWPGHQSPVEGDHRAFLMWQDRVYLPSMSWSSPQPETVLSVDVDPGELTQGPKVPLGGSDVTGLRGGYADLQRVVVVDDRIWLVGSAAVVQVAAGNRAVGEVLTF